MNNTTELLNEAEIEVYYKELQDLIIVYSAHLNHLRYQFFKKFNLSSHQYAFLKVLISHYPSPINMMKVRELMPEKMSDVTRIANRLEKEEYIMRKQDSTDKRIVEVKITEKGINMLNEIENNSQTLTEHLKTLSNEELELLGKIIKKINI